MKQHALELFGYCMGFLGLVAKPRRPEEPIPAGSSGPGPCPVDPCEPGSNHGPVTEHLVQIGGIALDYHPLMPGASAHIDSSGRRRLGPVRIVASVG
jgi:hypothetical protein